MSSERRFLKQPDSQVGIEQRGGKPVIHGYASVYYDGSAGSEYELWQGAKERIMPGAFDRAVSERDDVVGLFNHDENQVLGRLSSGTLRLKADKRGLRYEIDPPTQGAGPVVTELIQRGDIRGSSFAFRATDERWGRENDVDIREIHGVELFDVSPVTRPAYEGTVVAVRSDDAKRSHEEWLARRDAEAKRDADATLRLRLRMEAMR